MNLNFPILLGFTVIAGLSLHAQQAAPAVSAENARQKLEESRASKSTALSESPPASSPSAPTPKSGAPLSFNNVPPPPPKVVPQRGHIKTKDGGKATIIDALNLDYNHDGSVATYTGNVRLRSISTDIDCEELVVYFRPGALDGSGNGDGTAKKPAPTPGAAPAPLSSGSNPAPGAEPKAANDEEGEKIHKAVAKGKGGIVTIVKRAPKDVRVCKCGEATYEGQTGNLVMRIWPEVYQGGKGLKATERGTVLSLDKTNHLSADGPLKTILPGDDDDKSNGAKDSAPAPANAPAPAKPGATTAPGGPASPRPR